MFDISSYQFVKFRIINIAMEILHDTYEKYNTEIRCLKKQINA